MRTFTYMDAGFEGNSHLVQGHPPATGATWRLAFSKERVSLSMLITKPSCIYKRILGFGCITQMLPPRFENKDQ